MDIDCHTHGTRDSAVVCRHQLDVRDRRVGWVEICSDPDDLQAGCDDCEAMFVRCDGMTDEFRQFNSFAMVCVDCYAVMKARHE